jgi:hypothetical protein
MNLLTSHAQHSTFSCEENGKQGRRLPSKRSSRKGRRLLKLDGPCPRAQTSYEVPGPSPQGPPPPGWGDTRSTGEHVDARRDANSWHRPTNSHQALNAHGSRTATTDDAPSRARGEYLDPAHSQPSINGRDGHSF